MLGSMTFRTSRSHISISGRKELTIAKLPLFESSESKLAGAISSHSSARGKADRVIS